MPESHPRSTDANLDCLPPQNEERFRSLSEETGELVNKNILNLICLFYSYADSHAVDTGFYEDLLVLVARDCERV